MPDFQFKKNERLASRKVIAALFKEGQSFAQYPLRVVWLPVESAAEGAPAQFALSVPKKKFPKAVHRNRMRRLVREAWRLNKHGLYESAPAEGSGLAVMVLYTGVEELPFAVIEAAMKQLIRRLSKKWRSQ